MITFMYTCDVSIAISSTKVLLLLLKKKKNALSPVEKVDPVPSHAHTSTRLLPSSPLKEKSVTLFHSPQPGLFTTTSSRLKLHSYSAPGMPAAMQQSKQSVILYHLHPWERSNGAGKRRKRGTVRGGTEMGGLGGGEGHGRERGGAECETSGTG